MKKRLLAGFLTVTMLVSLFPIPALALEGERPEWAVTAFDPLDEGTALQTVTQGGGEPVLPDALTAWAYRIEDDTEVIAPPEGTEQTPPADGQEEPPATGENSGEADPAPMEDGGNTLTAALVENDPALADEQWPDIQQITIPNVTWTAEPEYDHNTPGAYIYTPVLPAAYAVDEGVELPTITVTVEAAQEPEQTAVERVQALIDALPDPEGITLDNAEDTAARLAAIDEASETLTGEEQAALDFTRYEAVMLTLAALMDDTPTFFTTANNIQYLDCDTNGQKWTTKTCSSATVVENDTTTWTTGWYVVNSNVTVGSRITVNGTVHLILADGCKLTANGGINVSSDNGLTIYAQSTGDSMGQLSAKDDESYRAGIGGDKYESGGTITINGGSVTATGGKWGAGIGSGGNGGGTITINGGSVTATGGDWGAGIGSDSGGTITISGGSVTANGGGSGAGIGSDSGSPSGTIIISGGSVTANGGDAGAGIGGGFEGAGGSITITGGTVTANGGGQAAGIGGGYKGAGGSITITGGTVTAVHGRGDGAGIGGGKGGAGGTIIISGGSVSADGGAFCAGVGGGDGGAGGTFSTGTNGSAVIAASSISDQSGKGNWSGVIIQRNSGEVYGNPTLTGDVMIPSGKTVTISAGKTLTIPKGVTLTNDGTIEINGTLTNNGIIVNGGTITGTVGGNGKFGVWVTFDANGGSTVTPSKIANIINENYQFPASDPTRTGYTFDGWYTEQSGGTKVESTTTVTNTSAHTLYAHWTLGKYTVTFNAQGGSVSPESAQVTYSSTYGELPTPTKSGYTFTGWYTAASGGEKVESTTTVTITAAQTLYAHWTANQYTVTFNANEGSVDPGTINVTYGGTYGTLPIPTRSGYTFDGWYTAASGGDKIEDTSMVTITAAQTLYAHWLKNTSYIDADGSTHDAGAVSITDQTTWSAGWYVVDSNTTISDRITVSGDVKLILADGFTLTASQGISVNNPNSLTIYCQSGRTGALIATNPSGGGAAIGGSRGSGSGQNGQKAGTIVINGGNITANVPSTNQGGACIGQSGWNGAGGTVTINGGYLKLSCKVGGEGAFGGGGTRTINGGVVEFTGTSNNRNTIDSVTKNTGIVFKESAGQVYGSTVLPFNYTIPNGKTLTILEGKTLTVPTGSTLANNGTLKIDGTLTANGTFTNSSTTQVKVALNANGGTVSPNSGYVSFTSGGVSGLPTPTQSGFAFAGWYTAQSGGATIESMTPLTLTPGQALYAHWTANQYTVTFNANGGSVTADPKNVTYGETYGTLPTPTRSGYTFDGWYTEVSGGTKVESTTQVTITAAQTLYAHWTANQYTVTFNANEGSVTPGSLKVTYGGAYGTLPTPTRSGYTFDGWYTEASGGDKIESTTTVTITADQTLYARWLKNTPYIDADGTTHDAGAVSVTDQTTWTTGWYVVDSDTVINSRFTVSGDVKLILKDGCTLTASQGINVSNGNSLTIYAQSTGDNMGKLTATGGDKQAGIGSGENVAGGVITINGGDVTASGGSYAAGIGGGSGQVSGGTITINGGRVTANRRMSYGSFGAAIGGGNNSKGAAITINGGTVTANGQIGAGTDQKGSASNSFSTGTNGHAVIFSESISDTSGQGSWKGIIFLGNAGAIYGSSITLQDDLKIPSGKTLTIPTGTTLTINSGVTVTVQGDVNAQGTTVNNGNIVKKNQTAPSAPTASAQTASSITLNAVSGGKGGVEYKCGDGSWQTGTTFDSLTAGTAYTFTIRYKGNDYYQEARSTATIHTAAATPTNPAGCYEINYSAETVTAKTGYEISTNGTDWTTSAVSVTPGNTIYVRVAAVSGGAPASEKVSSTLPGRPTAPTNTDACSIDTGTEQITVKNGYEVNTNANFGSGTAVTTGTKINPGTTLYARKAATDNSFCSTAQTITAPSRGAKPDVSINYTNETLTTTTAMEYTTNGGTSWTDCTADMAATAFGWDGTAAVTVQFRTKATGSSYASEVQDTLTIPARPEAPALSYNPNTEQVEISGGTYYYNTTGADYGNTWTQATSNFGVDPGTTVYIYAPATASAFKSAVQTLEAHGRGAAPKNLTVNYSDETINTTAGMEWNTVKDSSTGWSNCSADMSVTTWADTGKTVYIRYKAASDNPASNSAEVTIPKRPAAPSGLTIDNAAEGVTLSNVYCYNSTSATHTGAWTAGTGSNVTVQPGASIYIRTLAADSAFRSAVLTLTAPSRGSTPTVNIDYAAETLGTTTAMQYKVGTGSWADCEDGMAATTFGWSGKAAVTVQFRTKATGNNYASEAVDVTIPARPAAPNVQGVNETLSGESDGQITGTSTAMEYGTDGNNWTVCTGTSITSLAPGTYYVRTKAVTGASPAFASGNATVTIQAGQDRTYTLKVTAPAFAAATYGYTQPAPQAITIKNDGNSAATIASVAVSDGFTIGGSGSSVAAGGSITSWTVQPNTELAVGTHTGTITVTYDGGATITATVSFTVNKAPLTPSAAADNKTYDGTTAATGIINLTGAVNGESPAASGTFAFEDANAGTGKTVKVTNITLDDGWGKNYQLSSNSMTTTATIEPKSISGATVTLGDSLTYNGQQQAQTVSSVEVDSLTATYTVSNNQQTDAGTYTLTVTGNGNFTGSQTAGFTIAKASNSITSLTCDNIVFGETPDPSATAAFGTVTYTYSQQENGTYGAWSASNDVGKWYVKAAVTGTDNYDGAEATASFQVTAQREETPSAAISCSDETLTGLTADASYSITPADGTAVTVPADSSGRIVIQEGWFGKALSIVKIARDGDYSDSEAQSLPIPARPAAPSTKIMVKKTDTSITITNKADFGGCEFSIDRTNWQDSEVFTGLSAGQTYPVSVRTKATDTAFASSSQTVDVTTVNADGSTTVKPGESAEVGTSPKTTVTNDGEKITITTGNTTTTVTPAGEVEVGTGGGVTVPGGSTVKPGNGGPEITVGPGSGGTIGGNGEITIPGGGTAQIGTSPSTTITVPEGGGTIQPKPGGTVDVPGGSTIKTGDNGPEITVGPENGGTVGSDGGITVPSGGTVQVGKDPATTVTPPPGGEVKPKGDGTVEVPGGTTVKPSGGGSEITVGPGNSGTVGDDGGVTVPGGGKVTVKGDPDTTITLPSPDGGTVKPNPDGTIPLTGGTVVTPAGKDPITVPDGGGTYNPSTGTVTENVHTVTFDSQGGSAVSPATATHGRTVANPGSPTRTGYTFGGWYKESACTNAWNFDTDTVTGDIILYAKWAEDAPTHTHSYSSTWSSDANNHWHECSCGEKSAIAAHIPGEWIIDREATSTTAGSRHKACTACGYIAQTESIPATGGGPSGDNSGGGGGWYNPTTTYPVTTPATFPHGKLTVSPSRAERNTTVTITVIPDNGYRLDILDVTSGGKAIPLTEKGSGKYTFTMPAGTVKVEATFVPAETPGTPWLNPFADVPEGAWYYDAVRFVSENGLMSGYGSGLFGVNDNLSRAQLAQILFNKEGRPVVNYLLQYNDVATGLWYTEAIRWATSQGVVGGYGNGMFGPNDPITREQLAVMLWRYSGSPAATNKELHFNDADEIGGFALEALRWAVENGIINGYGDERLGPQGLATRAQVAQMLKNFLENREDED